MYLKIKHKKIEIKEYTKFFDRRKTFKFYLEPIDFGIKLPHKKYWTTYFFCQRVDICITNKENKIIKLYENVKSEKRKLIWKSYNIYYLPLGTCKNLKLNDKLVEKK